MFFFLLACADERGPRPATDPVEYDGYIYAGPTDTETLLDAGRIEFLPEGADTPILATQPFEEVPGYWRANLPAGSPFTLHVVGSTGYTALWHGTAPTNSGSWFTGALFGADVTQVDAFFTSLPLPINITPQYLGDGQIAHLWGYPWIADGWDCALITVNEVHPLCYLQDPETGQTTRVESGPLTYFVALNLLPGPVVVDSGIGGTETYQVEGGDLVYAFWFSATGEAGS